MVNKAKEKERGKRLRAESPRLLGSTLFVEIVGAVIISGLFLLWVILSVVLALFGGGVIGELIFRYMLGIKITGSIIISLIPFFGPFINLYRLWSFGWI